MAVTYKIINTKKRLAVRCADVAVNLAATTGALRRGDSRPLLECSDAIEGILIVRLAYIGDVVMTLPVIAPLKQAFPNARIDFLTSRSAAPLVRSDPNVDEVIEFDAPWFYPSAGGATTGAIVQRLKRSAYDLGVDFRGDLRNIYHCLWRSGIPRRLSYTSGGGGTLLTHRVDWRDLTHKVEYHLDLLRHSGLDAPYSDPKIAITEEERVEARALLEEAFGKGFDAPIVIHPGARLELKQFPAKRFGELSERLASGTGRGVVLVGTSDDEPRAREIRLRESVAADLTGKLSIRMLAAVLSEAACLVCHDSAAMHIAAAVGTPVVALFGPSRPAETAPCIQESEVLEGFCPQKDNCDETHCRESIRARCILSISVDAVYDRTVSLLKR